MAAQTDYVFSPGTGATPPALAALAGLPKPLHAVVLLGPAAQADANSCSNGPPRRYTGAPIGPYVPLNASGSSIRQRFLRL